MSAQPKYRPSLTLAQMNHIIHLIDNSAYDPVSASVKRVLQPMIFKASEGIIQPAFVTASKPSLTDSLGFSSSEDPGKALYDLWRAGTKLSDSQTESAMAYGFNNDLLTDAECDTYTQLILNS